MGRGSKQWAVCSGQSAVSSENHSGTRPTLNAKKVRPIRNPVILSMTTTYKNPSNPRFNPV